MVSAISVCSVFALFLLPHWVDSELTRDKQALLDFLSKASHANRVQWNPSNSVCNWTGVDCDSDHSFVLSLRLPDVGLVGPIPPDTIGKLTRLRVLSLRSNRLSGEIPSDFSNLVMLQNLHLQDNAFSGDFPSSLTRLTGLTCLDLSSNNFSGSIPPAVDDLSHLTALFLQSNGFSGSIPSISAVNLTNFNVSNNKLNGSIPNSLAKFPASSFAGNLNLCDGPFPSCNSSPARKSKELSTAEINGIIIGSLFAFGIPLFLIFNWYHEHDQRKRRRARIRATTRTMPAVKGGTSSSKDNRSRMRPATIAMPVSKEGMSSSKENGSQITIAMRAMPTTKGGTSSKDNQSSITTATKAMPVTKGGTSSSKENGSRITTATRAIPTTKGGMSSSKDDNTRGTVERNKLVFFKGGRYKFEMEDLLNASAEVLGKGSVGTSYKAVLEEGTVVVVKRLKEKECHLNMEVLGNIEHPNVVPIRAFYFSKEENLLVYDYFPTASLSTCLHGSKDSKSTVLNWNSRMKIALSVGRGLAHLHLVSNVVHGNIKSSNILLQPDHVACLSDFGLNTPSNNLAGYEAPDIHQTKKVTFKSDVYSYGVLLLEILTGKAPNEQSLREYGINLPRWVQSVVIKEWTVEVFDAELMRLHDVEVEMVELLQIAMSCVSMNPDTRPPVLEVVRMIEDLNISSEADDTFKGSDVNMSPLESTL